MKYALLYLCLFLNTYTVRAESDISNELDPFNQCVDFTGRLAHFSWQRTELCLGLCLGLLLLNIPVSIILLSIYGPRLTKRAGSVKLSHPNKTTRGGVANGEGRSAASTRDSTRHQGGERTADLESTDAEVGRTGPSRSSRSGFVIFLTVILYLISWALVTIVPFLIQAVHYCVKPEYSQTGLWAAYAICDVSLLLVSTFTIGFAFIGPGKESARSKVHRHSSPAQRPTTTPSPSPPVGILRTTTPEADWIGRSHTQVRINDTPQWSHGSNTTEVTPRIRLVASERTPPRPSMQSVMSRPSSHLQLPPYLRLKRQDFDASRAFSNPDDLLREAGQDIDETERAPNSSVPTASSSLQYISPCPPTAWGRHNTVSWYARTGSARRYSFRRPSTPTSTQCSSLRLPSPLRRSLSVQTATSRIVVMDEDAHLAPPPLRTSRSAVEASSCYESTRDGMDVSSTHASMGDTGSVVIHPRVERSSHQDESFEA